MIQGGQSHVNPGAAATGPARWCRHQASVAFACAPAIASRHEASPIIDSAVTVTAQLPSPLAQPSTTQVRSKRDIDVLPVGREKLLVLNDNNFPFSNGRNPARPDNNEAIVLRVPGLRG